MRLLCAALAAILVSPLASAQWTLQSPIPTSLTLTGVGAPTPDRVVVVTGSDVIESGGALIESPDGGVSWQRRLVPSGGTGGFNGVTFYDDQFGIAYGNENHRTTDGGATWTPLPFFATTYGVEIHTPSFAGAITNFVPFVTRDGGDTWDVSPDGLFAFDFADASVGLGASGSGVYRTTDGGLTFGLVHAGAALDVAFLTPTLAVAIADDTFLRSTDAGATWTPAGPAAGRSVLVAVSATDVLAWGLTSFSPNADGQLYRSADGGQSWTDLGTVFPDGTGAVVAVDEATVVATDMRGDAFQSTDAGATWSQTYASPGATPGIEGAVPVFPDASTGYLGLGQGLVLKTVDGGASWTQVGSGYGRTLNGFFGAVDVPLAAVGDQGTVLTYDGIGWVLQAAPTTRKLVEVQAFSETDLMVVDTRGVVHASPDGGATWNSASLPSSLTDVRDFFFSSPTDGWVVGNGVPSIRHTTDGGATWAPVTTTSGLVSAIDFEGDAGWALRFSGSVLRTVDGGATWTEVDLPGSPGSVTDVEFFDASVGYVVGSVGYAVRSVDGGQTWQTLAPLPMPNDLLTDLWVVGPNELWVSSSQGRAYYSANGGFSWAALDAAPPGGGALNAVYGTSTGQAWVAGVRGTVLAFDGPPPPPDNQAPEAAFSYLAFGLQASFEDASTDPDGTVVAWAWDFGDGVGTSTEVDPAYTYAAEGTYVARLTVTDDAGATDVATRVVVVQPLPGGTFGDFVEVTPFDPLFVTPADEDFWVASVAPADVDGDGDLDLAALGYYVVYNQSVDERLVLFLNEGEASPTQWAFTALDVALDTLSTGRSHLAWGDPDGDGDPDLLVATDDAAVLFLNEGGTLTGSPTVLPPYAEENSQAYFDLRSVSWADVDNDGDDDLLMPSVRATPGAPFRTALLRNDGPDGSGGLAFTELAAGFAATAHAQTAWADADGDGDLDVLVANVDPIFDEGFIRLYRNDGGTFTGQDLLSGLSVDRGEVEWGDVDADGDLDLLVAGLVQEDGAFDTVLRLYRDDAGTYTPVDLIACPFCEGWFDFTAVSWADYDSDGDADILLAGTYNSGENIEGRAQILLNEGGTFVPEPSFLPAPHAAGDRGGTFSWVDLDGDGDLDYVIAGEYFTPGGNGLVESQIHVYRNDAPTANTAPLAPTGLSASVGAAQAAALDGATVSLVWNPSSDDSTPAPALTYDLDIRLGETPVAMTPLPEPGALGAVTGWVLTGLADGTYTWTVRAVDSAFNGSAPASGQFTVGASGGVSILIDGPKGFRFLGTPAAGMTVDDLAAMNLVRGVPGYYPSATPPNLETIFDTAAGAWIPSTGTGEVLELGRAFRWRFYDHANGNPTISQSVPLPMTLTTTLPANTADVTVELGTGGARMNYLANPFGTDLDLTGIASWPGGDHISPNAPVWVYDPVSRSFVDAPATIPAWMGFRVRAKGPTIGGNPRLLTTPASAAFSGGRVAQTAEPQPGLAFSLSGTDADGLQIGDRGFALRFADDARAAFDAEEDVEKFQVPAEAYALLGARVGSQFVGYDVRPFAAAEIPLAIEARGTGSRFTLAWDPTALPAGLPVVLVDLATGAEVDVRRQSSVTFEASPVTAWTEDEVARLGDLSDGSAATDRFVLRIGSPALASAEAISEVALTGIAPNPSAGSARVSFAVPEAGAVRLSVVDVRGREVATLVDGPLGAGRHEAMLDREALAAGVYVVRLEAAGTVVTRQAVVVR